MKKNLLTIALCGLSSVLFAQGAFVKLGVGYSLPAASSALMYKSSSTTSATNTSGSDEVIKSSFGKGINATLGVGYNITESLGFVLDFSYAKSGKIEGTSTSTNNTTSPAITSKSTQTLNNTTMIISPAFQVLSN